MRATLVIAAAAAGFFSAPAFAENRCGAPDVRESLLKNLSELMEGESYSVVSMTKGMTIRFNASKPDIECRYWIEFSDGDKGWTRIKVKKNKRGKEEMSLVMEPKR